ncbi:hypothetical protein Goshw_024442 [Gossypium schwendimanii]|uniref:RNase H type-1 domain-containing protein n=1 Tax=Gossypium schwendimanii TaxID=34291 RepID=A0A7J9MVB9_GOSSC|nr:hypothetical protein [Gossypium schwendimanii]
MGPEIVAWIKRYIKEMEDCKVKNLTKRNEPTNWCAPDGSDVKLNFDATFDESQAKLVSGVVARNASEEVLAVKTTAHGMVVSSFAAEAHTCLQAVLMGKQMGLTSIIIEGDSTSIIKKSKLERMDNSVIEALIRNIQQQKRYFQQIIFRHVSRYANLMAHNLARNAMREESRSFEVGLRRRREPN